MKTIRNLIIAVLGILLVANCNLVDATPTIDMSLPPTKVTSPSPTKDTSSLKAVLDKQQEKWIAQNIGHYRYSVEFICLCPGVNWPLVVEIKDDQVISATDATGVQLTFDLVEWYSEYLGVDRLFDLLHAWNNGLYTVRVTFFETGAPRHINIVADNCETECTFEISMSNFEKLP